MKNTAINTGYDVYFEDTGETIEFFTPRLGDAYRIAKREFLNTLRPVSINKCNEECYVESDGKPFGETVEFISYKKLITIGFLE